MRHAGLFLSLGGWDEGEGSVEGEGAGEGLIGSKALWGTELCLLLISLLTIPSTLSGLLSLLRPGSLGLRVILPASLQSLTAMQM